MLNRKRFWTELMPGRLVMFSYYPLYTVIPDISLAETSEASKRPQDQTHSPLRDYEPAVGTTYYMKWLKPACRFMKLMLSAREMSQAYPLLYCSYHVIARFILSLTYRYTALFTMPLSYTAICFVIHAIVVSKWYEHQNRLPKKGLCPPQALNSSRKWRIIRRRVLKK